jgi:hypothetical protein
MEKEYRVICTNSKIKLLRIDSQNGLRVINIKIQSFAAGICRTECLTSCETIISYNAIFTVVVQSTYDLDQASDLMVEEPSEGWRGGSV